MVLIIVLGAVPAMFGAGYSQARSLVREAAQAMGGEEGLRAIYSMQLKGIGHRYMLEQSPRATV